MDPAIRPNSFDHVALWVAERDALSDLLCDHLGMHVIEKTDSFTLVGVDAREGKLTLSGANTFSGNITISAGTVIAGSAVALGTTVGTTAVEIGATLDVNAINLGLELVSVAGAQGSVGR